MTDQELADQIVELEVGKVYRAINGDAYEPPDPFRALGEDVRCYPAKQFVRDWRVFGALWEKMYAKGESDDCRKMIEDLVGALND